MIRVPKLFWVGAPRLPADATRALLALSAATVAGAAWAAGVYTEAAGLAALAGLIVLIRCLWRFAAAERLAADLCGDRGDGAVPPLSQSLPILAARLAETGHRASNHHPVTGLPTRERMFERLQAAIAGDCGVQLIGALRFMDYDRLAAFDQTAANAALSCLAGRLMSATGPGQVVAQVDRDCFAIWFQDQDVEAAAAQFRAIVYVAGQEISAGSTILTPALETGAARYPMDGEDATRLLLRATGALSRPEILPTGEMALVEPPSLDAAREQFMLEQDLVRAIAEDQLTMVFQPVVDLAAGRLIGAEALLRWEHPKFGVVPPSRFIPIVESIGLSERYGLWVLNTACREAQRWRDEGLPGLKVAVNLSARQLLDPDLRTKIERTLSRHRLDPGALELELTETAAMADAGRTLHLFGELRAMGVSLAIDDFGSGYSSLSYLKNLPFDKLKIDREFITSIQDRPDSRAICKALIELGRGLGLLVLAEGVENRGEVAALRELGCTLFQGYYFSKPLSGEAFQRLANDVDWVTSLRTPAPAPRRAKKLQGSLSA